MEINALVSAYGPNDFGVTSPQVPALFGGSPDPSTYSLEGLTPLLRSAGAPDEFDLRVHRQTYMSDDDHEWFVRIFHDPLPRRLEERRRVLHDFRELLDATHEPLQCATPSATGEVTFVMALPEDKVSWVAGQMFPGDVVTLVVPAEDGLITFDMSSDPDAFVGKAARAADPNSTVGDLLAASTPRDVDVVIPFTPPSHDFLSDEPLPRVQRRQPALVG